MTANELIRIVSRYSLVERLKIVEAILKQIREDNFAKNNNSNPKNTPQNNGFLSFAGILNETEARIFENAIDESRKIDSNEW